MKLVAISGCALWFGSVAYGQCAQDSVVLGPPEVSFARGIAVQGDRSVSVHSGGGPEGAGTLHMLERRVHDGGWDVVQEIHPGSATHTPFRGTDVDLDGDVALVGDGDWESNNFFPRGRVLAYERDPEDGVWHLTDQFSYPSAWYNNYGRSLDLDGDWAVIGARLFVEVVKRNPSTGEWSAQQYIPYNHLTPAVFAGNEFGRSVALQGDYLIVSASEAYQSTPTGGSQIFAGEVDVFRRDAVSGEFVFLQRLMPLLSDRGGVFGRQLSLVGPWLAISSPFAQDGGLDDGGALYLYRLNDVSGEFDFVDRVGGSQVPDPQNYQFWGYSLGVGDGFVAVGTPLWDDNAGFWDEFGRILILPLDETGLKQGQSFYVAEGPIPGTTSGRELAVDGLRLLSLDRGQGTAGSIPGPGLLRWFDFDSTDCNSNGVPDLCDVRDATSFDRNQNGVPDECERVGEVYCGPAVVNSSGQSALIRGLGSSAVDGELALHALQVPDGEFGYFLASSGPDWVPMAGTSVGNLCLAGGPNFGRFNSQVQQAVGGEFWIQVDVNQIPTSQAPMAMQPGDTWYFQAWFRDAATSNFTEGLEVNFE